MNISYEGFTKRLKEERIRLQISQSAMSKKVRMLPSHYLKAENGFNRFTFYELQDLCSTEVDIFYSFTGKRSSHMNDYEELFHDANLEQMACCLQMINLCANIKRKKNSLKEEWEQIYADLKYLMYVDIGLPEERNIFKAVRDCNGMTQMRLAEELGMDIKKLRSLESDKILPDSEILFKMYEKYGISPSAFLRNKKCMQKEIAYLINSHTSKIGEELLVFVKTVMFFIC